MALVACEADVRVGGTYRFVFGLGDSNHPSKAAVDEAIAFGEGRRETFGQLDELLATLGAS